jgi:hypothetical protein
MKILDGAPKTFRGTEWNPAIVAAVGSIPNAPHCWGLFDTSLPLGYPQKRSRFWCLEIQTNLPQQLQICAEYHKEYTSTQRERESSVYLLSVYHPSIYHLSSIINLSVGFLRRSRYVAQAGLKLSHAAITTVNLRTSSSPWR